MAKRPPSAFARARGKIASAVKRAAPARQAAGAAAREATSPPAPRSSKVHRVVAPEEISRIIKRYTWGAAAAMFAIPVPGVDIAATFAVWGAMIREIAAAHGEQISPQDGARLASELFKNALLTGFAWFGSAKVATTLLKFVPFGGTLTAYAVDAAVAAVGAKRITAAVGNAAALYYGTGKIVAPRTLREHLAVVTEDQHSLRTRLASLKSRRRR